MSDAWIEGWLGVPRFQRYLDECNQDRQSALNLYEWNSSVSMALMRDISHFEIALRNAYDATLSAAYPSTTHWIIDKQSPVHQPIMRRRSRGSTKQLIDVNYRQRKRVEDSIHYLKKRGSTVNAGKVIAQMSFGYWMDMSAKSHDSVIWSPALQNLFGHNASRSTIDSNVRQIVDVRNRIAHHEPIVLLGGGAGTTPTDIHALIVQTLGWFALEIRDYVADTSLVIATVGARP